MSVFSVCLGKATSTLRSCATKLSNIFEEKKIAAYIRWKTSNRFLPHWAERKHVLHVRLLQQTRFTLSSKNLARVQSFDDKAFVLLSIIFLSNYSTWLLYCVPVSREHSYRVSTCGTNSEWWLTRKMFTECQASAYMGTKTFKTH